VYGQLGLSDQVNRSSPVQVGTLSNWSQIYSGMFYVAAIKTGGTLWTWGDNGYGQLGLVDTTPLPTKVVYGI
jgi:alpha-tubulin suppressor-like RCC1 family protein